MNRRVIRTILMKELVETVRDKTTLFINYGLPLFLWPITAIWLGEFLSVEMEKIKTEARQIAMIGTELPEISLQLASSKQLKRTELKPQVRDRALQAVESFFKKPPSQGKDVVVERDPVWRLLRDEKLAALIAIRPEKSETGILNHRVIAFYDQTELISMRTIRSVTEELIKIKSTLLENRLKEKGLPWEFVTPLIVKEEDVGETRTIGNVVGRIAPYFLLVIISLATYYTAIHTVVGERERGTLASLLSTPVGAKELMTGKFLNIVSNGVLSISIHVMTSSLCLWLMPKSDVAYPTLHQPYLIPVVAVSAVVFMSAIALLLTTISRTIREANGILSAFMIVVILPAAFVTLADLSLNYATALIPLANVALVIKSLFIDPVNLGNIALVVLSNVACGLAIFAFAVHLFRSDAVLFRGEATFADLFTLNRATLKGPTPGLSFLVFSSCLLASIYSNFGLASASVFFTVPFTQLFVYLLIPALFVRYFRLDTKEVFLLRRPKILALVGAFISALGVAYLLASFASLFPAPKLLMEEFSKKMGIQDPNISGWMMVVVFGLLPGVCEEVAFRGIILSGLRQRLSTFWSVILTALLFGLNHFSLYRIIPTALGGLVLGWIACRTLSIFPGMLCHLVYNSALLLAAKHSDQLERLGLWKSEGSATSCLVAAAVLSGGLWLVSRSSREPRER